MYDAPTFDNLLGNSPSSETPLIPSEAQTKKVIIHYWLEYNAGKHIVLEVDAGIDFTVIDLMRVMQREIIRQLGIRNELNSYVVRTANKVGQPKVDIPIFETSQKVQSLGFVRFVLCDAELDQKARGGIEEVYYTNETQQSSNLTEVKTHSFWKKCLCCDEE